MFFEDDLEKIFCVFLEFVFYGLKFGSDWIHNLPNLVGCVFRKQGQPFWLASGVALGFSCDALMPKGSNL